MNAYYDGSCIVLNKGSIGILRAALKAQAGNLRAMLSQFEGHIPLEEVNGIIQHNIRVCENLNVMLSLLEVKAKPNEVTKIELSEPQTTLFPTEPFPTPSPDNANAKPWTPPADCRARLRKEGKPYPRSSCAACGGAGGVIPRGGECQRALEQERG